MLHLTATKDQAYDNSYNYNVQSFIYNLIRDSPFNNIHDSKNEVPANTSVTPFCFSNIFPYGNMRQKETRNLIISSPNENLIEFIFTKLKKSNSLVVLGRLEFKLTNLKLYVLKTTTPLKIYTSTPIILRIPAKQYRQYDIELKHSFKYIFWRNTFPLEILLNNLHINLKKKFFHYYKKYPNSSLSFTKLIFRKQVSKKLLIHSSVQTIIGSLWEFWLDEENDLVKFALDAGLGERNRLGFGFLNPCE